MRMRKWKWIKFQFYMWNKIETSLASQNNRRINTFFSTVSLSPCPSSGHKCAVYSIWIWIFPIADRTLRNNANNCSGWFCWRKSASALVVFLLGWDYWCVRISSAAISRRKILYERKRSWIKWLTVLPIYEVPLKLIVITVSFSNIFDAVTGLPCAWMKRHCEADVLPVKCIAVCWTWNVYGR